MLREKKKQTKKKPAQMHTHKHTKRARDETPPLAFATPFTRTPKSVHPCAHAAVPSRLTHLSEVLSEDDILDGAEHGRDVAGVGRARDVRVDGLGCRVEVAALELLADPANGGLVAVGTDL